MPASVFAPLLDALRARITAEVRGTVHGGDLHLERYDRPPGDPGLIPAPADGGERLPWRVHAHVTGMLTGGFAALMLQSLHPLAMAAVDQHSDFRTDPVGRLNRTVRFVNATTFGSTASARAALDTVRRVHTFVHGTAPDGRPYRADDPALLTWVHTAEVRCFLAGYQVFGPEPLGPADCDRYYDQAAVVAEELGAKDVPRSAREVARYLSAIRPELSATPAAIEALRFLRGFGRTPVERAAVRVLMNASLGLLPGWARAELGVRRPLPVRRGLDRPAARALGGTLQWARGPSLLALATERRVAGAAGSAGTEDGPAGEV